MSVVSECDVLVMFGTPDCAGPARNVLEMHKILKRLKSLNRNKERI
jgi:hypothetical protein